MDALELIKNSNKKDLRRILEEHRKMIKIISSEYNRGTGTPLSREVESELLTFLTELQYKLDTRISTKGK